MSDVARLGERDDQYERWQKRDPVEKRAEYIPFDELLEIASGTSSYQETGGDDLDLPYWRYDEYRCRSCGQMCINDRKEGWTRHRECQKCFAVPVLDRTLVDQRHLDLLWAHWLVADERTTASLGEARRGSGASGANASASGAPAGSDPLRVDPEAEAQARSEARAVPDGGEHQ